MNEIRLDAERAPIAAPHVVRLSTHIWQDARGLNYRRRLATLQRLSRQRAEMELEETCEWIGAEETLALIKNFHQCPDGVYVVQSNWKGDECTYELVPFTPERPTPA